MIDVNQITTTLRGLPDRALQQYAMMHKGDPYILSLAVSESNQRKQLRAAGQGQAGAMPQPKVADSAIAGMSQQQLPENQGIAQIPTPNMQSMADGGIAGYEDDEEGMATGGMGGMFNFAQQSEPVVRMADGGMTNFSAGGDVDAARARRRAAQDILYGYGLIQRRNDPEGFQAAQSELKAAEAELRTAESLYNTEMAGSGLNRPATNRKDVGLAPTAGDMILPYGQSKATNVLGNAPPAPSLSGNKPPAPPPSGNKPPAPSTEKQGLATIAPSKAMTAEEAKTQAGDFVDYEESRTALRKAESDQESQGARLRTMLADSLPKTPALEGLEKLLDKQDAATGGEKDKAAGLALLSAGLAIAGGSSRFALQNLKEAIPAVTQYGEALKDIKKMERENMKLRGDIEQARRAEGRDDTKLKLQLEEKIGERQDNINKLGIDLTAKIAGTTADVASKLWSTSFDAQNRKDIALFEAQNRKDVAGISANAAANAELNKYKQLGEADPNSALRKGFSLFQQDRQQAGILATYEKMAGDQTMTTGGKYATKGEEFRAKYPTPDIYAAAIASLSGAGGQGQIYSDNNVNPNAIRTR
jgi:hypothetical protein